MRQCFKLFFLISFIPLLSLSQTKEDLQEKRKELQKEINYTSNLLSEIKESKFNSLMEVKTLGKKIEIREKIINSIFIEIELTERIIKNKKDELNLLKEEIAFLKNDFAKLIQQSYKSRNTYDRLLFIFSSRNFYQAYKRIKFIQQYSKYTKNQANKIQKKQSILKDKLIELDKNKIQKKNLIQNRTSEKNLLDNEKIKKDQFVKSLYKKENDLLKSIKIKQETAKNLELAIEKIIKEEIEKLKALKNKTSEYSLTPEAKKLSDDFEKNKGNLPWPVEKGLIVSDFGLQAHPILPGIKTNNNGIDIATNKGSIARSSFKGKVSAVIVIPGANKAVIIRHGEYLSVYSNLSEVFVKTGDNVKVKQELGLIYTGESTQIHFEIWKGTNKLNPANWLFF